MAQAQTPAPTPAPTPESPPKDTEPPTDIGASRLKADLDTLRGDLAQLTRTVRDLAGVRRDQGMAAARDYAAQASAQAQEAKARAEQTISANPLLSVAAAFGVGYLLGRLTKSD
jgi:ElaB/YqjD/DUF883 family membrane-anchored ribosome-binding protein